MYETAEVNILMDFPFVLLLCLVTFDINISLLYKKQRQQHGLFCISATCDNPLPPG